jgi:hypothetical protein
LIIDDLLFPGDKLTAKGGKLLGMHTGGKDKLGLRVL